ncbi:MAG: hypothetical protein LIV24_04410 [Eubacterium sp.]|nr:hypothetical protein [Eubacterium sp.]
MDLYFELLKHPVFTIEDVIPYYINLNSARSALGILKSKGQVAKIRRNLYTPISGETEAPLATRFQIASAIIATSCISHHTAMEYYGISDQVFYEVYVSSVSRFRDFEFDGYHYNYVKSEFENGVNRLEMSGGVRITDKERTVIDSIKDMDRIAGAEEVIDNIKAIRSLKEQSLLEYLSLYDNQFLYQKTGFILSHLDGQSGLSDSFYNICLSKTGKSVRYFSSDCKNGRYDKTWKLIAPDGIFGIKNGGDDAEL